MAGAISVSGAGAAHPQLRRACTAVASCSLNAGTGIATNGRGCHSFLKGFIRATGTCMIISRCFKAWR